MCNEAEDCTLTDRGCGGGWDQDPLADAAAVETSSMTGPVAREIDRKLREALAPVRLDIVDDSHRHEGHAGHDGRGESHFRVTIVSSAFVGKSRLQRQRLVHGLLATELADRVHALALRTVTPEEAN